MRELAAIAKSGPTDAEMTKTKNRLSAGFLLGLQSNLSRAQKLAEFEVYWGDASLLNKEVSRYLAVTKDDIARAVAKYLSEARRSRVVVTPPKAAKEGSVK
jgi:predicted Zn-dependent peptidase